MLVGFQEIAFQDIAFQMGGISPVATSVGGHFAEDDYRKYKKRLKSLQKAADDFDRKKYIEDAVEVAEIAAALTVVTPEIKKVASQVKKQQAVKFDFSSIQSEIRALIRQIEVEIDIKQMALAEMEDEEAILLLI